MSKRLFYIYREQEEMVVVLQNHLLFAFYQAQASRTFRSGGGEADLGGVASSGLVESLISESNGAREFSW